MSKEKINETDAVIENGGTVKGTETGTVKGKGKGTAKKPEPKKETKKLLSTFEFARAGSVAVAIRRLKLNGSPEKLTANSEKIIALADKIYFEKTGSPSNLKESKWNFLYAIRFLKFYESEKVK